MSLSSAVIDADSEDQLFLLVLLISGLLHGLVIVIGVVLEPENRSSGLSNEGKIRFTPSSNHRPDISFSINGTVSDSTTTENTQMPRSKPKSNKAAPTLDDQVKARSPTMHTDGSVAENTKNEKPRTRKPLKLDFNFEESETWHKKQDESKKGGTTKNGSTIVNGGLFKQVQKAKNSGEYKPSTDDELDVPALTSGGGSRIVKIGERCFIFTDANPLDSLSRETWARTKCNY